MIGAQTRPAAAVFVARLAARAKTIAEARAEETQREAKRDPWRWRTPRLLWPLFD